MSAPDGGPLAERDPLADLVSRGLGRRVESVEVEELAAEPGVERKRVRFAASGGPTSAMLERRRRGEVLEAQLLPFLARKTDRVPIVYARGIPPPSAALGPWLLLEDVLAGTHVGDDAAGIVRAKLAIERAVAADLPALRALGLRTLRPPGPLDASPLGLVHGALTCAAARRVERGIVLVGWSHAFLGPTVIDGATLARDLAARGDAAGAARVRDVFMRESGDVDVERWTAAVEWTLA